ncbi:MAG: phage major tail tube protein [Holophagales bacterium]|jgi:P2 family phage contractile tail tube protein|nr:phage major tail tube protein [Holophagales bacterium]
MANVFKLHSANIYLNGSNMPHVASEITLPSVKHKTTTHAPTALKFSFNIPIGVEPMELKIKGDFDPSFVAASLNTAHVHSLQVYSDLVEYDDAQGRLSEKQVVAYMQVMFTETTPGAVKNGEAVEMDFTASVLSYKLEVEGVTLFDLTGLSNKHEVLGMNLNATNNNIIAR